MRKSIVSLFVAALVATAVAAAAAPSTSRAAWCWPGCSSFGYLGPSTSTSNGCWYATGEVCSGWNFWSSTGINKQCYPRCDGNGWTQARVLYGFENAQRIRGWYTDYAVTTYIFPSHVSMGGYLRAQVSWFPYLDPSITSYTSYIHVGAI
jgi:hypothetical protein